MKAKTITTSNTAVLVIPLLLIAAYGTQLSAQVRATQLRGKYSSRPPTENVSLALGSNPFEIEFMSGNKAHYRDSARGQNMEVDYEVRGRQVMIKYPQGTVVATIGDDGCLDGGDEAGVYGKLCKDPFEEAALDSRVCVPSILATGTSYTKEMPDPARVLADFHGSDSLDTAARQMAALSMLKNVVTSLARPGSDDRRFAPEENELLARYNRAEWHIDSTYHLNTQEYVEPFRRYYGSGTFFRALVHRYLSACNRDRLFEVLRARREARRN